VKREILMEASFDEGLRSSSKTESPVFFAIGNLEISSLCFFCVDVEKKSVILLRLVVCTE